MPEKEFIVWLEGCTLLVWRKTEAGILTEFRVVLLDESDKGTHCIARYDTAHGFPHQDILGHAAGTLAKKWFFDSSVREVFEYAIRDLQQNAEDYRAFYWSH
jgi:hypothetical protein